MGEYDFWLGFRLGARLRGVPEFTLFCLTDSPYHIECVFWVVLEFVAQDAFAAVDRVFEADKLSFYAAELLGREKRLREKSFQSPSARHHLAVVWGQLLQAEHRDDILQILVLRQSVSDLLSKTIVAFANDAGSGHLRV